MKLFKKLKKGFTLVELVVVIAVIAILAAISVVSYIGVTNKAKAAADSEIITQLNTQMRSKSIMEGPNKTAYEAYLDAREIGFNLELMKPSSSGKFVWDQSTDLFACVEVNKDNKTLGKVIAEDKSKKFVNNAEKNWVFTPEINSEAEFCQYLNSKDKNENAINAPATIKVKSGFDAGENMTVKSVIFDRKNETTAKEVVIRTNGGSLVIDDESEGTIYHYNKADTVKILECHTASYHEFGTVPFVEIAEGHIVFETGSAAGSIHVDTKYINKSAGTKETSTFGNVEISVAAGAAMPEFSRDSVETIADNGTKVCTLDLAGEKNDVVLFQDGIYEQIKIENVTDGARWVDTSNATQATKTAADQLANNISGEKGTDYTIAEETRELTIVNETNAKITNGSIGICLVHNMEELQTVLTNKAKYITFANEISYPTNGTGLVNVTYSCTIDGAGYALSGYGTRSGNKTTLAINNGGSSMVNVSFKNLTINNSGQTGRPIETRGNIGTINFDNVIINATGGGNTQCLTIGGNQATSAVVNINNSTFDAGSGGYPIITFNPIDLKINNSNIEGYCSVYFKAPSSSAGSFGSVLTAVNSTFDAPNLYNGYTNGFGVFVMETDDIKINLTDCAVNGKCHGTADQAVFYEDSFLEKEEESVQNEYNVYGEKTTINGNIFEEEYAYNFTSRIWNLTAGTYKEDPSSYVGNGYKAVDNGNGTWTVVKK